MSQALLITVGKSFTHTNAKGECILLNARLFVLKVPGLYLCKFYRCSDNTVYWSVKMYHCSQYYYTSYTALYHIPRESS